MKKHCLGKLAIFFLAVSFILIGRISMAETGGNNLDELRVSVERSSISAGDKSAILKKAHDAVNAGLPSADIAAIVKRGLSRGVGAKEIENFIGIAVRARARNVPVRPVLDRLEQGLSKGVPPDKISAFTGRLVEKLGIANRVVYDLSRRGLRAGSVADKEAGTEAVARALEKSIPEETIRGMGIRAAGKGSSLATFNASVNTASSFVEMGMPIGHASRLINKAIDRGYTEREMMSMEGKMATELREGMRMEDIMKGMDAMMDSGMMRGGKGMGAGSGMGGNPMSHDTPGTGFPSGIGSGGMGGGMGGGMRGGRR